MHGSRQELMASLTRFHGEGLQIPAMSEQGLHATHDQWLVR
jgi:hypothetical protein